MYQFPNENVMYSLLFCGCGVFVKILVELRYQKNNMKTHGGYALR